jgi:hypothetical protein
MVDLFNKAETTDLGSSALKAQKGLASRDPRGGVKAASGLILEGW